MASRRNGDGTTSFVTADPALVEAFEFLDSVREGRRVLILRDAQHEYVFTEGKR